VSIYLNIFMYTHVCAIYSVQVRVYRTQVVKGLNDTYDIVFSK